VTPPTEAAARARTVICVVVGLHNGVKVVIRPIRPDDKALLDDGVKRLSPESAYRRFLSPKRTLSADELRYLTEVDFRDHYALVAVRADDPRALVGVGRWIRSPRDRGVAEAAILVWDELQGHGLGTALAAALADSARERGVRRFTATMLATNVAARRVFARIAKRLQLRVAGGVYELSAELPT
jgi:RimJ/RimL family protein N-acetyltransferase